MSIVTPVASPSSASAATAMVSRKALLRRREVPVAIALLVVLIGTSISNHRFLSSQGRTDLMLAAAITGMIAIGETFVLLMRKVDLSVGSTLGLAAYAAGTAIKDGGDGQLMKAFIVGIAVGLCVGLFNGLLIALLDLPALVVTLGTLYVVAGIQAKIIGGKRITADHLPADVISFGVDRVFGVPKLMWIVIGVGIVASLYLRHAHSGRDLYAVGSNPPAAMLVGIPVRTRTVLAYLVSGGCAGAAGVLFVARLGGVDANAGRGYELAVIAACVVGGVNIFGGSGTVVGALLGAMLLRTIGFSLSALSIPEFWQQAVNGALLLVAISADRVVTIRRDRAERMRHR
jgi:rhamnose transport system permease protein